jgi:CRISPR-associated protein (TIGR02584 family)
MKRTVRKKTTLVATLSGIGPAKESELVFLAVSGMSPAVLTETIWALAHEETPVIPDRIVVVTTTRGQAVLEKELFTPVQKGKPDLWQVLRDQILAAHDRPRTKLNLDTIRLISVPNPRTGRSEPLEDFRTSEENAAVANYLLDQVRGLVETPGVRLITSIAGGRKTLGVLLYACMSLLGRETDRVTHVLVSEPYDNPGLKPRFYFPEQPIQKLSLDGKSYTADQARIDLGDIPFVPLRNLFDRQGFTRPSTFTGLVERCRQKVSEFASRNVKLKIWRKRTEIEVNGVKVNPSNPQHLLLLFLVEKETAADRGLVSKFNTAIEPLRAFGEKVYAQRNTKDFSDWRGEARLPSSFDDQNLRRLLNDLKEKLKAAGAEAAMLAPLLPAKGRFSLDLAPTGIEIVD